jgi:lipopolysaccharide export system permease protein
MFALVDRYLLKQLAQSLALCLGVVSLVVFFSDTVFDALRELQHLGVALPVAITFITLQVPQALSLALPISLFLSTLLVYSQLNQQLELIALRLSGFSLWRLLRPALLVGALCALLQFTLLDAWVPQAQQHSEALKRQLLNQSQVQLTQEGLTLPLFDDLGQLKNLLYAQHAEPDHLQGLTYLEHPKAAPQANPHKAQWLQLIQAKNAHYQGGAWRLHGVQAYMLKEGDSGSNPSSSPNNSQVAYQALEELQRPYLLDPAKKLEALAGHLKSEQLSFAQLAAFIGQQEAQSGGQVPSPKLYLKLWERWSAPLNCLLWVLCALPLALAPPRQRNSQGFVLALALLVLFFVVKALVFTISPHRLPLLLFGWALSPSQVACALAFVPSLLLALMGGLGLQQKNRQL